MSEAEAIGANTNTADTHASAFVRRVDHNTIPLPKLLARYPDPVAHHDNRSGLPITITIAIVIPFDE